MLGYKVWIDKNALLGGEKIWEEIDQQIRNKAAKMLLVYSKNICQKDESNNPVLGKLKDGIYKEYSLAESVSKQNTLIDFIILLNKDESEYDLFIGADRLNQIPFFDNWAEGLSQLEKKLSRDAILKSEPENNADFAEWYEQKYKVPNGVILRNELYYTNWWGIPKLPSCFYIYEFSTEEKAKAIYEHYNDFPISRITNHISSFQSDFEFKVIQDENSHIIKPQNSFQISINDILLGFDSKNFPTQRDSENHLKHLLKRIFHLVMKKRGMFWYEMANKRLAYYYTPANLSTLKVKFEYPYRMKKKFKRKNLIGKHKNLGNWHYAVSVRPILYPVVAYSLKNHLTFTSDGFNVWKKDNDEIDTDKIHTNRRAKGKGFFNEEWRDLLLAFLEGLKKEGKIQIALSRDFILVMPQHPELFWAEFGYYDPKDKTRQGLLSTYESEDEKEEELNNEI